VAAKLTAGKSIDPIATTLIKVRNAMLISKMKDEPRLSAGFVFGSANGN
jgi:hypothetical protein